MPPPTTTHHQPKYICHHPPPTTTSHHHPKNGLPPSKSQSIFIYSSFWYCFNSFFFFQMQYSFPWWRLCVIKFWSIRFSNSKFLYILRYLRFFEVYISRVRGYLLLGEYATKKNQSLSLFSFKRQFNMFFSLCTIDDWKPRIKKNMTSYRTSRTKQSKFY